uniref:Uncharacterized protein n=1 Tax=Arundo donax TaxID=35708 RepID=A0A0A9DD77_ARUDO
MELWYIEPLLCMTLSSRFASRYLEGKLLQWKFGILSRHGSPNFLSGRFDWQNLLSCASPLELSVSSLIGFMLSLAALCRERFPIKETLTR